VHGILEMVDARSTAEPAPPDASVDDDRGASVVVAPTLVTDGRDVGVGVGAGLRF
jgi:hypothetical protein